jgi:hypothetical protein
MEQNNRNDMSEENRVSMRTHINDIVSEIEETASPQPIYWNRPAQRGRNDSEQLT